jgi:hypothetical protein
MTAVETRTADEAREARIAELLELIRTETDHRSARQLFESVRREIAARSAEQVTRMEKARGLA